MLSEYFFKNKSIENVHPKKKPKKKDMLRKIHQGKCGSYIHYTSQCDAVNMYGNEEKTCEVRIALYFIMLITFNEVLIQHYR
jgi:hypothetical protein